MQVNAFRRSCREAATVSLAAAGVGTVRALRAAARAPGFIVGNRGDVMAGAATRGAIRHHRSAARRCSAIGP